MLFSLVLVTMVSIFLNLVDHGVLVEMFKVRMQGQYGAASDKRLRDIAKEMWREWGFTRGIMRGYWVRALLASNLSRHIGVDSESLI